ncbi:MAG: TIGR04348 family glycosyltransferase [Rhodospirillaceae bacterium]|jgi:putative glycosyltransferase (TIGR04348 family)|nr:TIGR04348 family glycosyltransferase [Rhodospirillaceae bacterium]
MKISLVTPAGKQSRAGNRTTAVRWARILRDLGHRVDVSLHDEGRGADMMVAVHAWRSAASIRAFSDTHPDRPLVVLLAGTDIYAFQHSHPEETLDSLERATAIVCLHDLVHKAIPRRFHKKLRVIYQSSPPLPRPRTPLKRSFDVCVVGHLRDEKDSLRAAYAARQMPEESRLRVVHLGQAHTREWARDAKAEMKRNPRYDWRGEVAGWQVRRQFGRSYAMVISSVMEGGANVVSEAITAGLPVLASDIDGNIGLLGKDYRGYYASRDTDALAALLRRAEFEPRFLKSLGTQIRKLQPKFRPVHESTAWRKLLRDLKVI